MKTAITLIGAIGTVYVLAMIAERVSAARHRKPAAEDYPIKHLDTTQGKVI